MGEKQNQGARRWVSSRVYGQHASKPEKRINKMDDWRQLSQPHFKNSKRP